MKIRIAALAGLVVAAGCSPTPATQPANGLTPAPLAQCAKDTDCKGDRICDRGMCANPPAPSAPAQGESSTPANATPAADPALETKLTDALRLKPGTIDRVGDSGAAIRAYIAGGYVDKAPGARMDYSDYRIVRKPITFMGHSLVALEEEYMSEYVGCCVSPGMAVTVRLTPGGGDLDAFAKANGCHVERDTEQFSSVEQLESLGLPKAPKGTYATLECKERDIEQPDE